jgi:hypothetical protein
MEDIVIPKAQPERQGFLKKGVYPAQIEKVEWLKDDNGNRKLSQKGDPALVVTFKTQTGLEYPETYWMGEKAQFRIDKLLKDIGVDNSKDGVSGSKMLKKKLWIVIAEESQQYADGTQKMKEKDGKSYPVVYTVLIDTKPYTINGVKTEKPEYSDDLLSTVRKDKSAAPAGKGKPAAAPTTFKATGDKKTTKPAVEETTEEEETEEDTSFEQAEDGWGD